MVGDAFPSFFDEIRSDEAKFACKIKTEARPALSKLGILDRQSDLAHAVLMISECAAARAVVDLFEAELSEVRFPDVDAAALRALVLAVTEARELAQRAERQLGEARAAALEAEDRLGAAAQRALAYARVYAERDAALAERVGQLSTPRGPRGKAPQPGVASALPKRRGRPPKSGAAPLLEAGERAVS